MDKSFSSRVDSICISQPENLRQSFSSIEFPTDVDSGLILSEINPENRCRKGQSSRGRRCEATFLRNGEGNSQHLFPPSYRYNSWLWMCNCVWVTESQPSDTNSSPSRSESVSTIGPIEDTLAKRFQRNVIWQKLQPDWTFIAVSAALDRILA